MIKQRASSGSIRMSWIVFSGPMMMIIFPNSFLITCLDLHKDVLVPKKTSECWTFVLESPSMVTPQLLLLNTWYSLSNDRASEVFWPCRKCNLVGTHTLVETLSDERATRCWLFKFVPSGICFHQDEEITILVIWLLLLLLGGCSYLPPLCTSNVTIWPSNAPKYPQQVVLL